ncbi:hypothetical protein TCAL_08848, partial [Tigriopus californicus]|eukprot:TCALIF_08848-PA protein Name:"Protein of unknown function" AED:0.12 eAED:0.13 QI:74/1/0.5/1/1/0.5/2/0/180
MDKEDLIPGQISCSDAEEDSDGSESSVNKLEWTMKNPHLSGVEDVESLASSSESVDMSKDDELEQDDSLIISEELAVEQSNIADICDDDDGPKKNDDDDLEDVIELDRPPSPNKGVIYPSPPQYAPPSQEFQQQQLQYQQQQYQAQIGMPQPLAPVSSMQVANQMVCYPPQSTGFLLPPQ